MPKYTRETLKNLLDGKLPFSEVKVMMSSFKDPERFEMMLEIHQSRVPWPEKILLPLGLHLYIVLKENGDRVVKCDCGYEFGDYRKNWKLNALVYVRDTEEKIAEIYPKLMGPDPRWMEIREYYCPGCSTQLEVESVPPGYPVIFDFKPDIDAFYEKWLGKPVPTVE
ncbi:acetone carboxylase subunit gamma [Thermoflavimicrobium dichotomicum]|uniref:Acetone carboxylase, gamma subunit n=1 Tax=Thermoflavimicrobium dichotomicum TaxID=46223 RepID=A0A1I3T736_9BACL|nr:acetone carboxylase subunit gamma [Thermoflavimicrobium dichotomicum]SFJ66884.1 acetone carboxylase, gamma subunit [Thermoflavimicrobium dichotomicum]